jgi:hypothetical protein
MAPFKNKNCEQTHDLINTNHTILYHTTMFKLGFSLGFSKSTQSVDSFWDLIFYALELFSMLH